MAPDEHTETRVGDGIVVRPVGVDDFAAVSALLAELGRPAVTPEREDAARAVFARHVAAPDTASLLAERDGVPIGFLALHFRERLNQVAPDAWIPDLIVTAREHGGGAAGALFRRAVELARARGCYRLVLESGHSRRRAHRFYQREGMTDAGKYFAMPLE